MFKRSLFKANYIEWLFTRDSDQKKGDSDTFGHGACGAYKAADWLSGVSKSTIIASIE